MNFIVYQSEGSLDLIVSLEQHELLKALGVWPCDLKGRAYARAWLVFEPVGGPSLTTSELLDYLGFAPLTMEVAA